LNGFLCLAQGDYPVAHGTLLRAMRVEFPGATYHVTDRRSRRELAVGSLALDLPSDKTVAT
jgi:hypothetical protein